MLYHPRLLFPFYITSFAARAAAFLSLSILVVKAMGSLLNKGGLSTSYYNDVV